MLAGGSPMFHAWPALNCRVPACSHAQSVLVIMQDFHPPQGSGSGGWQGLQGLHLFAPPTASPNSQSWLWNGMALESRQAQHDALRRNDTVIWKRGRGTCRRTCAHGQHHHHHLPHHLPRLQVPIWPQCMPTASTMRGKAKDTGNCTLGKLRSCRACCECCASAALHQPPMWLWGLKPACRPVDAAGEAAAPTRCFC